MVNGLLAHLQPVLELGGRLDHLGLELAVTAGYHVLQETLYTKELATILCRGSLKLQSHFSVWQKCTRACAQLIMFAYADMHMGYKCVRQHIPNEYLCMRAYEHRLTNVIAICYKGL